MGYALNAGGRWTVDRFKADTEDPKTLPQSEIHVIRFKSKEVDIQKRDPEFAFPCRTGEMVQEEQSSSTVVCQAVGDIWQECQEKPSEADREARDPSPDLEASTKLQDYKKSTYNGIMLFQRRSSMFPKEIFRYLSSILVCGDIQKQALMYIKERPWVIIGTRFAISHCLKLESM